MSYKIRLSYVGVTVFFKVKLPAAPIVIRHKCFIHQKGITTKLGKVSRN